MAQKLTKWSIARKIERIQKTKGDYSRIPEDRWPRTELVAYYNWLAENAGLDPIE